MQVNHTQLNAQKRFSETGLAIASRGPQSGTRHAMSFVRAWRPLVPCLLVILAVTLASGASTALASAPPSFQFGGVTAPNPHVFSTRMFAGATVFTNELDTKWRAEYSTNKSQLEEGSGALANSGEFKGNIGGGSGSALFGTEEPGRPLYHLAPNTHYFGRFIAENAAGTRVLPFEFATLPIVTPEVSVEAENQERGPDPNRTTFVAFADSPTTAQFSAEIQSNGATTTYSFGYSTSPSGPFTSCANGSITVAEDFAEPEVHCAGLLPETTYYARLLATNEKGTLERTKFAQSGGVEGSSFRTPTAKPVVFESSLRNVTAVSAHVKAGVTPHHEETRWRFESAPSALGPWTAVPGAAGTVSQAEAEALPGGTETFVGGDITGLTPATTYYVRLFAENAAGEGQNDGFGEPVLTETHGFASFRTTGPPTATTLALHTLDGESLRVIGGVDPNSARTSAEQTITIEGAPSGGTFTLTFNGATTRPIAFDASAEDVESALGQAVGPGVAVQGSVGGPYTVYFGGHVRFGAEHELGPLAEKAEPQVEADASGLTPSPQAAVKVVTVEKGGEGSDTHYHFQYISEQQFKQEGEWTNAISSPEADAGSGTVTQFVAANLPALKLGETYRYRIVATSTIPGNPVVDGEERSLTVPAAPAVELSASCSNEALRTGASANLPDCRGYEQLTPIEKEGAREPLNYAFSLGGGAAVGEDGEHLTLEAEGTSYGAAPTDGQSPYLFSRRGDGDWLMAAASTQPETGIHKSLLQLMTPDLSKFAYSSDFQTSPTTESKEIEYRVGPPGGPYVTVASVPVKQAGLGWVAASRDFSRMFLAAADRTLLGASTGTRQGDDLYEYSGGELRQVNVTGGAPGSTIGACGANIVDGDEEAGTVSSAHAVSSDGSRVFFEAIPSVNCSEPKHLYVRVGGEATVDIGAYKFIAANAEGTKVLLEKRGGEAREVLLYDSASGSVKPLFTVHQETRFMVSEDLSTIYFVSSEQLTPDAPADASSIYRYDVPAGALSFIDSGENITEITSWKVSSDGRYLYFGAEVLGGVPGGQRAKLSNEKKPQVYRYDSAESFAQCMSCASSFDPEPRLTAVFGETGGTGGMLQSRTGTPRTEVASANGDYVFFDTASALLPADVDGEVAPEAGAGDQGIENGSGFFSVSSDVYEWRKPGVDGCTHLQGCLALITNGRGGFLNVFLGTDESGRDAFFYTNSELVSQDEDTAGDIYDARIGGGTPPAPLRPVECEGDACSTPASAPNDATPSSSTLSGHGNLAQLPSTKPVAKPKVKTKKKVKSKKKAKGRHTKKHKSKGRGGKASRGSGKTVFSRRSK